MTPKPKWNISSPEGRRYYIHGLAEIAKLIAAEEKNAKLQLELFEKLKTEDVTHKM